MRGTLRRRRALDRAWNERRWEDYASLLAEDLVAFGAGEVQAHGKAEHVARARRFCAAAPAAALEIEPYIELFATLDGAKSGAVMRRTGASEAVVAVLNTWREGRIVLEREFLARRDGAAET